MTSGVGENCVVEDRFLRYMKTMKEKCGIDIFSDKTDPRVNPSSVSNLVYESLDGCVARFYPPDVVSVIKTLYTPSGICDMIRDEKEIWAAVSSQGLEWVMSLHNNQGRNLELSMFYGKCGIKGARSADYLFKKAESRVIEGNYNFLIGKVLRSGWGFITNVGNRYGNLTFSEPYTVIERNRVTGKEIAFEVADYKYSPRVSMRPAHICSHV
ncbi:MAG: hypothetical protein Q8N99_06560 [Nanoarchaeota archaeon]|nr:hypothetical protein [Nanoarchaeota archaeon]